MKNYQGHQKQGESEDLPQLGGTQGDVTSKYKLQSWMRSWNKKKKETRQKSKKSEYTVDFR